MYIKNPFWLKDVATFWLKGLANTAWAFVTACEPDAPLFAALARAAERRLSDFSAQGLANTAWAFATASLMRRCLRRWRGRRSGA